MLKGNDLLTFSLSAKRPRPNATYRQDEFIQAFMLFEKSPFPCRGATLEPSPAFFKAGMKSAHQIQSPQRRLILPFSSRSTVAAATKLAWDWRPALKKPG